MTKTCRTFALCLATLGLAACNAQPEDGARDGARDGAQDGPARSAEKNVADEHAHAGGHDEAGHHAHAKGHGEEDADHAGCIYAEGEKDEGEHECPHGPQGEAGAAGGGEGHFGSPFTLADAKPLGETVETGAGEAPVLVEGEVEAVCQKKGCWMVIKDGATQARVLMKDHGFSVPMDCRGKKAVIEGTLATRTFDEAQVKHLAKDGGENPDEVSGERTEHVLTASGVEIKSVS